MQVDGFEQDLDLCSFGPWEEINGETHEWIRHCSTCKNYQTTTEDPNKVVETPEFVEATMKPDETNTGSAAS